MFIMDIDDEDPDLTQHAFAVPTAHCTAAGLAVQGEADLMRDFFRVLSQPGSGSRESELSV